MDNNNIKNLDKEFIMNSYNRFNIVIQKGKGSTLYDIDNKEYIDFSSGIGVNSFGASDDMWINSIVKQLSKIQHTSNLYYSIPQVELAELLIQKSKMKKVFFSNSGAEANECAIKACRKYSKDKYNLDNRFEIITLNNSFHGRTMATLTATGQDVFHKHFDPFLEGFKYVELNNINDLKNKVNENTCGILIETIQGEGGIVLIEKNFILEIEKICNEKDILFMIDEVQTGIGRTGYFFSYEEYNVKPDIVTTAKGLGGGLPIGATLFNEKTENVFSYGDHGTTFGGNLLSCSGAISIVNRIDNNFLLDIKEKSRYFINEISKYKNVEYISGKGLMLGIKTNKKSRELAEQCLEKGLIVLTAKDKVRLLPPLNITYGEINKGLKILKEVIEE